MNAHVQGLVPGPLANGSAADPSFAVTFFSSVGGDTKHEERFTMPTLAQRINSVTASTKDRLGWLKLATFGGARTEKACLRNDANVLKVTGIEADYDAEQMPMDEAVEIATNADLSCIIYTSPSHTEAKPRWRVLCPFTEPMDPYNRQAMLGRLNGLYGGIFSGESWTLSQSYYYGSVNRNPAHQVAVVDGQPIDELHDLDRVWRGKPDTKPASGHNDTPRMGALDEAALLAAIASGDDYHQASVRLLGKWAMAGVPLMDARQRLIDTFEKVPDADRDARWEKRHADVGRCVGDIYGKEAKQKDDGKRRPMEPDAAPDDLADLVDPATLQGMEPPDRDWIVDGWLPVGTVTSLYGGAGFGKTLLAQQLQTATAIGAPFLGLQTAQCKSLAFYCEDDADELHRRQRGICWHYGAEMKDLGAMRWQARAGKQNIMVTVENGLLKFSEFADFVWRAVEATGAKLVILDNIAQLFGGNENVRPDVTQFVNSLSAIALEHNAAVLLLGHPGKATDSQYSGSTAWDAAVRSRWLLERVAVEAGEDDAAGLADLRVLKKSKANYAGTGDEIPLRWVEGAFKVEGAASVQRVIDLAEITAGMVTEDKAFLDCLDELTEQGRHLSASAKAHNYAPKVMKGKPAAAGVSGKKLAAAMERLFNAGEIEVGAFGRDKFRRQVFGIIRKGAAVSAAGCSDDCSTVAAECADDGSTGAAGCSTVQAECSTHTCNPLISLQHDNAAETQQSAAEIEISH